MRNLKLQMNISLGDKWDDEMTRFSIDNLNEVDNIVLGRNTAEDFIPYWDKVGVNPGDEFYQLGKLLHEIPKVVFSGKLTGSKWKNAELANGDIATEIKSLKTRKGKDMMVYGGDSFAGSLIRNDLVDDCYLLVNPLALGSGQSFFNPLKENQQLTIKECRPFPSGTILLHYSR